jgi:hypothetical protein
MLGSLLSAAGTIPYAIETIRGKTKPRIVTWFTWALLTAIAGCAALADRQFGATLFAFIGTAATGTVVLIGLRYGDRTFGRLDVMCVFGVLVGLALWLWFQLAAIAIWAAIVVDFVGLIPTIAHAWRKPGEETAKTFVLVGLGGLLTTVVIAVNGAISVTALGYPLYVAVSMGGCAAIIQSRRSILRPIEESL